MKKPRANSDAIKGKRWTRAAPEEGKSLALVGFRKRLSEPTSAMHPARLKRRDAMQRHRSANAGQHGFKLPDKGLRGIGLLQKAGFLGQFQLQPGR